ncbi:hypothetical protein GGI24_002367 [Coemansia furcata]|nr:hypothetical protein GGI24_002367 [Coemansia furcata]
MTFKFNGDMDGLDAAKWMKYIKEHLKIYVLICSNASKVLMVLQLIPDEVQSKALVSVCLTEDSLTLSIIETCLKKEFPAKLWSDYWQKALNSNTLCVGILHTWATHQVNQAFNCIELNNLMAKRVMFPLLAVYMPTFTSTHMDLPLVHDLTATSFDMDVNQLFLELEVTKKKIQHAKDIDKQICLIQAMSATKKHFKAEIMVTQADFKCITSKSIDKIMTVIMTSNTFAIQKWIK